MVTPSKQVAVLVAIIMTLAGIAPFFMYHVRYVDYLKNLPFLDETTRYNCTNLSCDWRGTRGEMRQALDQARMPGSANMLCYCPRPTCTHIYVIGWYEGGCY